jgi:hypothetical protein
MRSHVAWFTASPSDLSTLALLIWRVSSPKAAALWGQARKAQLVRPYERLVLDCMNVDEAAERLALRPTTSREAEKFSPIGVLASMLVRERVKKHAAALFVRTVIPDQSFEWAASDGEAADRAEEDERATIEAAKSLGGQMGELGEMLERIWKTGVCTLEDVDCVFEDNDGEGEEPEHDSLEEGIKCLLKAVILYRRIFPTSLGSCSNGTSNGVSILLSPPPSPSRKNAKLHLALRRMLGSSVFDFTDVPGADRETGKSHAKRENDESLGVALEDARDRVIDMLVDLERQKRGNTRKVDAGISAQ